MASQIIVYVASDYSGQTYSAGDNSENVDSMAQRFGYLLKDGSIVQQTVEKYCLSAGDACLAFQISDGPLGIQDGRCCVFEYVC